MSTAELAQDQRERAREVAEPDAEVELDVGTGEDIQELQAEIEMTAEGFRVSDFKCQKCGLAHGHDTDKHRASDSFELSHEEAAEMDFNPNCHCGAHELAQRGGDFGVDESKAANTARSAPVPESVKKQLR